MTLFEILCLAAALAMDAFSVSVSSGMSADCTLLNAFKMAFMFGLFQFIMPLLGNGAALLFVGYTERFSPLIVAALLAFIGIRMIRDSRNDSLPQNPFSLPTLTVLAFATSVDALAAGVSVGAAGMPVLFPAAIIGIVAFAFSAAGVCAGKFTKRLLPFPAGIAGGIILILIALKSALSFVF